MPESLDFRIIGQPAKIANGPIWVTEPHIGPFRSGKVALHGVR